MSRRFFDPQPFSANIPAVLGDNASHHIGKVLRMKAGDSLEVFNGEGGEWKAEIQAISKNSVTVLPLAFDAQDRVPAVRVTIALPLIKGERMDYALQKATELGAWRFQILDMQRSDVRMNKERFEKKLRHFQQVVISACEQCGMNRVPEILPPAALQDFVKSDTSGLKLIAHPTLAPVEKAALAQYREITFLSGPEGGLTDDELAAAATAGYLGISLGERILRAETAPVTGLSLLVI